MEILKIAVTGSAGSGKSLVCQRLGELGLVTLDCDRIARQVAEPGKKAYNKIIDLFGRQVVLEDKTLDRVAMRKMIIKKNALRKKLEKILHPEIQEEMIRQIENAEYGKAKAAAVEVPLLFETGTDKFFDLSIMVAAKVETLVNRIAERDGVSSEEARGILYLQLFQEEKKALADHIIINTGSCSELFDSVDKLFHKIEKQGLTM